MAYWLCITNETNWKIIKERNVRGVLERHKNTIAKVKPGDKLVIYLKQEKVNDEIKGSVKFSGLCRLLKLRDFLIHK